MVKHNYKKGFDFGDFEITKRELLASISILVIMLLIGIFLSGKIKEEQMDKNEIYNKAAKIESTDLFQYGMDTNIGNAFVYGDLKAIDTVTFPEIDGKYMYICKVEEHREKHTRPVTKEDSNGKKYTVQEPYYQWDTEHRESKHSENISFCDIVLPYSKINLPYTTLIKTVDGGKVWSWKSGEYVKVRFLYYVTHAELTGTIFTNLKDKTISDNTDFYNNMNIEQTVEYLKSSGDEIFFWIFWIILTCGVLYGFFYLDNNWLE